MAKKPPGFDEFDASIRRLVQVPKDELEAEEKKYQQQRKRLRSEGAKKAKRKRRS